MASVKDMTHWGINLDNCRLISLQDYEELRSTGCQPIENDVLIAKDGNSCLKTVCVHKKTIEMVLLSSVAILRPDSSQCDSRFLQYHLTNPLTKSELKNYVSGAAIPRVVLRDFKNYTFRLPSLGIQKKIGSILYAYDRLIENNNRRIKLLEESARLLYKEWFVHLRFPDHENIKVVDGVPEGWEIKLVNDVWNIKYGMTLPTKFVTKTGDFPVHGADKNIGFYVKKNTDESLCLVTCRGNGSGNVRRTFGPTFVTNNCFIFHPKYRVSDVKFYFAMMSMEVHNLRSLRTGSAQPQITLSGINHLLQLLPSSCLMKKFNEIVEPIFFQVDVLIRKNNSLSQSRDLLLPRLMSGELSV